jgi:hypothetical protein
MKKLNSWGMIIILATSFIFFQGCVAEHVSMKVEKSLPQSKLAYYNDSFDKLREDLWERGGMTWTKKQFSNFKFADIQIENGKLKIQTKTGSFSKGGIGSKFMLRGDFDFQVDCHIDFLKGISEYQQLNLSVADKGKYSSDIELIGMVVRKTKKSDTSYIIGIFRNWGKFHFEKKRPVGNFHGTMRMIRKGYNIKRLYKKEGDIEWKEISTKSFNKNDVMIGLTVQNFIGNKTSAGSSSAKGEFDNFRINAAQEIIEGDI